MFINVIINWYSELTNVVRWNGKDSDSFQVSSGIRQGSVLGPVLFNLYVDVILKSLRKTDLGCHLSSTYIGCIMYADDLLLLSGSIIDLQFMLNLCGSIGSELGISFNCNKSKCIYIGPNTLHSIGSLYINDSKLEWVKQVKYLGVWICFGKSFSIDLSETRRKFFMSVNCIISKCKYTSDLVKLELIESHCLPILLYATESLNLNKADLRVINVWWNSVYRRIFGYNKWESVKEVICLLGRLDLLHLVSIRRLTFIKNTCTNSKSNSVMFSIMKYFTCHAEYFDAFKNSDMLWSIPKLKAMTYVSFHNRCYP